MAVTKVVILNWNGKGHLRQFLPSVISNTPAEVEIIVADNGSDDGSLELLRDEFPSVGIVALDRNYGFAKGYNLALKQIPADYFILLNSDVEVAEGWTGPLIAALDSDPGVGAVAPKLRAYSAKDHFEYAGASGGFIDLFGYPFCRGRILSTVERDEGQYDSPRRVFWASGACMACRSELFTKLGGFDDEFFAHMEEIDLCWRSQLYGYRIAVAPQSVVYHLGGGTLPNNSPFKIYLNYRNSLAMLYKNLPWWKFLLIYLIRLDLDVLSALIYLLQGKPAFFKKVFRAHWDFYKWIPRLRVKRRKILADKIASPYGIYKGFIVLRYFLYSKKFGNLI